MAWRGSSQIQDSPRPRAGQPLPAVGQRQARLGLCHSEEGTEPLPPPPLPPPLPLGGGHSDVRTEGVCACTLDRQVLLWGQAGLGSLVPP